MRHFIVDYNIAVILLIILAFVLLLFSIIYFINLKYGCKHLYRLIQTREVRAESANGEVLGVKIISRCDKCGKIKIKDTSSIFS